MLHSKYFLVNKVIAYLYLFRTFESLILGGSFAVFAILAGVIDLTQLAIFMLAVSTLNFSIATWNDSLDINEDRVSHPERPIPSGRISIKEARIIGSVFAMISILAIGLLDAFGFVVFSSGFIIGILYSILSKKQFLAKNLTATVMIFLALLLTPWVFGKSLNAMLFLFAVSVAMMLSGYEILKDIRDVKGDALAGIDTLPLRWDMEKASKLATFFFVISCILMVIALAMFSYLVESFVALVTTIAISVPLVWLTNKPSPDRSDTVKYIVIVILGGAISIIGVLFYVRSSLV